MICLRCGHCCFQYAVVIVDDPAKGIVDTNLRTKSEPGERCPHIRGDKPGEYSCAIHDKPWYCDTPCASHGQIERSPDTPCRLGEFLLEKSCEEDHNNDQRPSIH